MEFFVRGEDAARQRSDCAIIGVYEPGEIAPSGRPIDRLTRGQLSRTIKRGDMPGKLGSTLLITHVGGSTTIARALLVGLGKPDKFEKKQYEIATAAAMRAVLRCGARDCISFLPHEEVEAGDPDDAVRWGIISAQHAAYRYTELKTDKPDKPSLKRFGFALPEHVNIDHGKKAVRIGSAIADGVELARDLGNRPSNVCTPSHLAKTARAIGAESEKTTVKILSEEEMKRQGMNSLLSVTAGAEEPAKLIVINYKGGKKDAAPVALVGKGVTFDTGGISMKPPEGMDEMKFDMCGAGSVLGTMQAIISMQLPLNVIGIVPACMNMPGGNATRPGDIVKSMSGQTIEILNTDAEGRLILCDALTYARTYKPETVIDIATLTGACVVALGKHISGLFTADDDLADELIDSGIAASDPTWRMPIGGEYQKQLKSPFADFANIGGRTAGAITAACFLSRFTEGLSWAHLDIAGVAWNSGSKKGATGRPVSLLAHFLMDRAR